jgi:hypothetical protein
VVYRGADQTDPVQNWSTLVEPGDIVKMAWEGSGGHHVTTVTGTVTAQGLPVFDNVAPGGTIGLHLANYWNGTDPASIIIFLRWPIWMGSRSPTSTPATGLTRPISAHATPRPIKTSRPAF